MLLDETKDLSLASFVCPPEVVHFSIVIGVSSDWLKTSYCPALLLGLKLNVIMFISTFRIRNMALLQE